MNPDITYQVVSTDSLDNLAWAPNPYTPKKLGGVLLHDKFSKVNPDFYTNADPGNYLLKEFGEEETKFYDGCETRRYRSLLPKEESKTVKQISIEWVCLDFGKNLIALPKFSSGNNTYPSIGLKRNQVYKAEELEFSVVNEQTVITLKPVPKEESKQSDVVKTNFWDGFDNFYKQSYKELDCIIQKLGWKGICEAMFNYQREATVGSSYKIIWAFDCKPDQQTESLKSRIEELERGNLADKKLYIEKTEALFKINDTTASKITSLETQLTEKEALIESLQQQLSEVGDSKWVENTLKLAIELRSELYLNHWEDETQTTINRIVNELNSHLPASPPKSK